MINYESHIQGNKPVVIDFFADWSQSCKLMAPILKKVKEAVGERASILNIDIGKEPALAKFYHILTVPTIIIFHNGQQLWRKNGISSTHEILEHLQMQIE